MSWENNRNYDEVSSIDVALEFHSSKDLSEALKKALIREEAEAEKARVQAALNKSKRIAELKAELQRLESE